MEINVQWLNTEDRIALGLKGLYRSYGFSEYRLSGFEDYSLYADNKSFLDGRGVLTFSVGGRLMALRPDVTLGVVKSVNAPLASGGLNKLYYDETVYRKNARGEFTELRQVGVEVIGDVDGVTETEVLELILKTLETTGREYFLDVSHSGIIEKLLNGMGLTQGDRKAALSCLERKSAHDFDRLVVSLGAVGVYVDAFRALITLETKARAAIDKLNAYARKCGIADEVAELESIVSSGGERVNVDFSIGGDSDYYNGVVFKGYTSGVPCAVLSGGRYDKLLDKFGKSGKAIGFALYLGELGNFTEDALAVPDVVVVYDDNTYKSAQSIAKKLRGQNMSVLVARDRGDFSSEVIVAEARHD